MYVSAKIRFLKALSNIFIFFKDLVEITDEEEVVVVVEEVSEVAGDEEEEGVEDLIENLEQQKN